MNKPSSFSLRGRKALVAIKDDRDRSIVRRQFERLGVQAETWLANSTCDVRADVMLIDDELLPLAPAALRTVLGAPVIALLGTETPSRLKLVLDLDPASFLVKPLRSAGIYAALVMAFERTARSNALKQQVLKLEERLRSRRIVLSAVLHVMQSHGLAEPAAFAQIRRAAMERRTTIEQMSVEIVANGLPRATG